jgi:alanine racemase
MLRKFVKRALKQIQNTDYQPLNRIEVSQRRILHNVNLIQEQHPDCGVMPVLKGNAYGHGLELIAEILNRTKGEYVAVDGYFEAAKIKYITTKRILVMGYILPGNVELLDSKRCSFVVQDIAGLRAFAGLRRPVRIHLELNTGMNRLGLQPKELASYLEELKKHPQLQLEGVMSHLADADNEMDDSFTDRQVAVFDAQVEKILTAGFRPKLIHIAQTAGGAKARSKYANTLRIGIGMYGISPLLVTDEYQQLFANLQPALELKSTIIKVLDLQKGDTVSYNCTYVAPKSMRIGVLPLGFYEGVPRALSNKGGVVTPGGAVLPVVGRICMNHTMIDISNTDLRVMDEVTVISHDSQSPTSVQGMQAEYGLFTYTTLVGLSDSVHREIVG